MVVRTRDDDIDDNLKTLDKMEILKFLHAPKKRLEKPMSIVGLLVTHLLDDPLGSHIGILSSQHNSEI